MTTVGFTGSTAVLTVRKYGQNETEEVHLVRSAGPADRFALLATSLKECKLSEAEIISAVDDLISLVRSVKGWGGCTCSAACRTRVHLPAPGACLCTQFVSRTSGMTRWTMTKKKP